MRQARQDAGEPVGFSRREAARGHHREVEIGRREAETLERAALAISKQVLEPEMALALQRPPLAEGEEPGEPAIAGAVPRIGEDVGRAIHEDKPRAYGDAQFAGEMSWLPGVPCPISRRATCARTTPASVLRSAMPIPSSPNAASLRHHLLGMRRPGEEREIRRDGEFGVGRWLWRTRWVVATGGS